MARRDAASDDADADAADDDAMDVSDFARGGAKGKHASTSASSHPHHLHHATPDETRRSLRSHRKHGGSASAEEIVGVSRPASPAIDAVVLRRIEQDVNKLVRRRAERARSRARTRKRDSTHEDIPLEAEARGTVVHTPMIATGGGGRKGSFASVAYADEEEEEEEEDDDGGTSASAFTSPPGSIAGSVASERERATMPAGAGGAALPPRAPPPPPPTHPAQGQGQGVTPDSLRYMEVMSRYLSTRGVHGSLLDELREEKSALTRLGAFYLTLVPIRPRSRDERRFLRT
jgi:hypothetical protein